MRLLILLLFCLPSLLSAQRTFPYEVGLSGSAENQQDPPGTKQQGVITVRKPALKPYFKCEYYLTLANVREVPVQVPSPSGFGVETMMQPVFDSMVYGRLNRRVHPTKMVNFSKMFEEKIRYTYPFGDTASIDTMAVELWIGKNGKIRWRNVDTAYGSTMPRELELEMYMIINEMTEWGQGGGYMTPKKFMRKQKRIAESYYCVLYVIASSQPITSQQKATGMHWTPMDFPLNAPEEEQESKEEEKGRMTQDKRNDSTVDKDPRK